MAMKIDGDACVDCGACLEPCPNTAIFKGGESWSHGGREQPPLSEKFYIVPDLCTQCVGYYDEPQCVPACPVDCIAIDAERREDPDELKAKSERLRVK